MPSDVNAVIAEAARSLEERLGELTVQLTEHFVEVIPEFRHDEAVRQLMIASTASNLGAIVHMLAHTIPLENISVPPAAAEYARRFAQHDLSLDALLRAYRLGERRFNQWALEALAGLGQVGPAEALAAASELSQRVGRYIDQVIEGLVDIYEDERRRWSGRTGAARAAQVRAVLDDEGLAEPSAEELLGVPLGVWHQAAIVWAPAGPADPGPALQAASRLLHDVSGRTPLTVLADDQTMWAWISGPARPAVDVAALSAQLARQPGLRMALGAPGHGLAGFRSSLREAGRARQVVETGAASPGPLATFDELAVAALMTDHPDDLRNWVARVLGDLAAPDPATAELRRTVQVFLQLGGSFTEAAARLHLHKNTVHYRVKKAEQVRGRPWAEERLDVEVALLLCEVLGLGLASQPGRDSS